MAPNAKVAKAAGVDLGGTNVKAGIFDDQGRLYGELIELPSRAQEPAEATRDAIFSALRDAMSSAEMKHGDLQGIGIGAPGPLDPRRGVILETPNLPALRDYPLLEVVKAEFPLEAKLSNDANCFALAEATFGAGAGKSLVLGITLGTGCGVGIVIAGRILEGPTASAAEVFRAIVGDRTYDDAISGTGLERLWREAHGDSLNGKAISSLADSGDARGLAVFESFADQAALGLGTFAALLDPDVIVLGGSVAESFEHFGERLKTEIRRYIADQTAAHMKIVPAKLGDKAGAAGAAALIFTGDRLA